MSADLKRFIIELHENLINLRDQGHQFSDKMFTYVENLLKQYERQ
jgi:hypothetical protein